MRQAPENGLVERVFTLGSATAFLALMAAVMWAVALPGPLLK